MLCKITKVTGTEHEQAKILKLPKTTYELDAYLQDMGIGKDNDFRYTISNVRTRNPDLDNALSLIYKDIDELNHIAAYISDLNEENLEKLGDIMSLEKPNHSIDFINIMHGFENCKMFKNVMDFKELGQLNAWGEFEMVPENIMGDCFDFEKYGKLVHEECGGEFSEKGYYISAKSEPVYDGLTFPKNKPFESMEVFEYSIVSHEQNCLSEDEPPTITITFPTTNHAIDHVINRLDAEGVDNCSIYHSVWKKVELGELISPTESITEINVLAEVVSDFGKKECNKLEALYEFDSGTTLADFINRAYNLDCYDFNSEIVTATDYGYLKFKNELIDKLDASTMDMKKYGLEELKKSGGMITEYGFIARNDKPMEQVYFPEDNVPEMSQQM